MSLSPYRRVLGSGPTRSTLLLGILVRVPMAAGGILLTLHVVDMGHTYGEAGLATMVMTIALALSGPWRGRLLDRLGLRRVVTPSLLILAVCWLIVPFVPYVPLLVVCSVAGLFMIPVFSIIRQAIIATVADGDRRTALSLDSVAVEISFMIGPVLGVWAATRYNTGWVMAVFGLAGVVAGALLWWVNPPMLAENAELEDDALDVDEHGKHTPRTWFTPAVMAVMGVTVAATVILVGTDLSLVAAMRQFGAIEQIGLVVTVWCIGSAVGGLIYGALSRPISAFVLLLGLALVTLPVAWTTNVTSMTALLLLAGLFCAPTITATVDQLSRLVPERNRGEAMGWHGSFLQVGSAAGAPIAGVMIDHGGYQAGFVTVALIGAAAALAGMAAVRVRRLIVGGRMGRPATGNMGN